MAPVCRFWPNCKYGDRCKFEHPSGRNAQQNNNRFAALDHYSPNDRNGGYQSGGGGYNQSSSYGGAASTTATQPYNLDKKQIISDLTVERPQWILSAYGPGRQAPGQLFGGPFREQSFEEMRLLHYMGLASGNPQQAVQEAEALVQASEQQIKSALDDVDGAIKFIMTAENEHPNRIDIVRDSQATTPAAPPASSLFGQPSIQTSNSFGAPSQQPSNVFGAPSQPSASTFGAPSSTATAGTFGQPSAIGQKPNPFGAPSRSAFGAPSQLGTSGTFGQPSALGQAANPFGASIGSSGFGQPSSLGQKSNAFGAQSTPSVGAFGQPTALGSKPNPFGAPSGPAAATTVPFSSFGGTTTAFGQPSENSNTFGAPSQPSGRVFGQPSQPIQGPLFGQPSSAAQPNHFGQPAGPAPNPFSTPVQAQTNSFGATGSLASGAVSQPVSTNPFGAPSQSTGSIFGAPSTIGSFGEPSVPAVTPNPFGKPTSNPSSLSNGPALNSFGGASQNPLSQSSKNETVPVKPYNPNATYTHPPLESYSSKDGSGKLTMFKGKRVAYRNGEAGTIEPDGSWSKIWFPEGPPAFKKDTEMEDSAYDDTTKKLYMHARETGSFLNGVMPLVPPKREWCLWDF